MASKPSLILPAFMWNYIVSCLDNKYIFKLTYVHVSFDLIIADRYWKRLFFDKNYNNSDIVIVNTVSNQIAHFWYYMYHYKVACNDIHDAFLTILHHSRFNISSKPTYYKVFIKQGEYFYDNNNGYYTYDENKIQGYNFNSKCSIEICGYKLQLSKIRATPEKRDNRHGSDTTTAYLQLNGLANFTMRNIRLKNISLYINNVIGNHKHNVLTLSNCKFDVNNHNEREEQQISVDFNYITISKCTFSNINLEINNYKSISYNKMDIPIVKYIISNNKFRCANCKPYIGLYGSCDGSSLVHLIENTFKHVIGIIGNAMDNCNILFCGNNIRDIGQVLDWGTYTNKYTSFEKNKFVDVYSLHDDNYDGTIEMTNDNIFEGCSWNKK